MVTDDAGDDTHSKLLGSDADKATVWCYFGGLEQIWLLLSERGPE
jgi:hypothetical protein